MLAFAFACGNNNGLERPGLDLTNKVTKVNVKPLYWYWSVTITTGLRQVAILQLQLQVLSLLKQKFSRIFGLSYCLQLVIEHFFETEELAMRDRKLFFPVTKQVKKSG